MFAHFEPGFGFDFGFGGGGVASIFYYLEECGVLECGVGASHFQGESLVEFSVCVVVVYNFVPVGSPTVSAIGLGVFEGDGVDVDGESYGCVVGVIDALCDGSTIGGMFEDGV